MKFYYFSSFEIVFHLAVVFTGGLWFSGKTEQISFFKSPLCSQRGETVKMF